VNVVDSSGWLEYLAGGTNADFFAPALKATLDGMAASKVIADKHSMDE